MRKGFASWILFTWIALLPVSWWCMSGRERPIPEGPEWRELQLPDGKGASAPLRYRIFPGGDPDTAPVLMIHGSPMTSSCFNPLIAAMGSRRTLIVPDLPGFGASRDGFQKLSFTAHASALRALLEKEATGAVHVVAYSQGGGPALELTEMTPRAIASLTLLSSIGTQEHELSGDYFLNHVLHGAQWVTLELLRWGLPHFGLLDDMMLNTRYARNFFEGDLRPLRGRLAALESPALILHGRSDFQVPPSAAKEHFRIIPQSELVWLTGGHLVLMRQPAAVATPLLDFLERVEQEKAIRRDRATAARRAQASQGFDPQRGTSLQGAALAIVMLAVGIGTLVSEDLACIAAGLLVARSVLPLGAGIAACFAGIWIGDMALYAIGRLGRSRAITFAPLQRLLESPAVNAARSWLDHRRGAAIFASRFLPGTRLPLYLAAGLLRLPVRPLMGWFALAAILWTVPVVALIAFFGEKASAWMVERGHQVFPLALIGVVVALVTLRLLSLAATHRGRRMLRAQWQRIVRWEFWPIWVFYPPLVLAVIAMGARRRRIFAFTAANPGIPHAGLVGESKSAILGALESSGSVVPFLLLPSSAENRADLVEAWMHKGAHSWPMVLKPDRGERGHDVRIVRDSAELARELEIRKADTIVQAYAPGEEFGVFYIGDPREPRGRIFSLTIKQLISVTGDGRRNLEELILDDDRAYLSHRHFRRLHRARLGTVPEPGEAVRLTDVGSHCRGALFLDGSHLISPKLEEEIDRIARHFDGFHFGRFDLRCPGPDQLMRGEALRIIELNGVTSEATHIYHPHMPLLTGYRTLIAQWRLAYEIGLVNHARGARISGAMELARLLWNHPRPPEA